MQYAWCWSHGVLHEFKIGDPWCSAMWERVYGSTREEALKDKLKRFGPQQFDDIIASPAHRRYLFEVALAGAYWDREFADSLKEFPKTHQVMEKDRYIRSARANEAAMEDLFAMHDLLGDIPVTW